MDKPKRLRKNYNRFLLYFLSIILIIAVISFMFFYKSQKERIVVVYVSHDQDYSEPILKEFENLYGIKVKAVYDTEATKSVGLVNRLIAEKNNPQADVFWNNEPMRSVLLKKKGILKPYCSPNSIDIPFQYKDEECYFTGFAARARVIIYNTKKVGENEEPKSIYDLLNPKWKGKICIANPLIGSTSTHLAALFALLGDEKAKEFLLKLKENGVQIVESNSMVRDQVVAGECYIGLTDTDDAFDAIKEGKDVKMVFPDQESIGTLVFPNTVMLINGAKHEEEGKLLIDFLLSPKVEEELSKTALQIPLKNSSKFSSELKMYIPEKLKGMNVSFEDVYSKMETAKLFVQEEFLR
jgi:iron(III) transport system substrate-binding protein